MTAAPLKVVLEFADNPLAGMPGHNDLIITVKSDPDIPLQPDGSPDPRLLESGAYCAAVAALAHVAGIAHSTALMTIARGSDS